MTGVNRPPQLMHVRPNLGCDPELFIEQAGKIVGSETVIPDAGLKSETGPYSSRGSIVQDGVQVELHPAPSTCRESMMFGLIQAFVTLKKQLDAANMKASFSSVIDMDPAELDKLSDKSKRLGCAPSMNAYDKNASISIDSTTYLKRSAGGHIHFGGVNRYHEQFLNAGYKVDPIDPVRYATAMDILLGNQSVMMDRDPNASERRKVYGRAGEFRTPSHGFEYRTLSNFWLRHCSLASGVLAMGRSAISVVYCTEAVRCGYASRGSYPWIDFESELLKRVDVNAVRDAINGNDLALAKRNWEGIRGFIQEFVPYPSPGLDAANLNEFEFFCHKIETKGLSYWFKKDPMEHWGVDLPKDPNGVLGKGWENFMVHTVRPKMTASKTWKSSRPTQA